MICQRCGREWNQAGFCNICKEEYDKKTAKQKQEYSGYSGCGCLLFFVGVLLLMPAPLSGILCIILAFIYWYVAKQQSQKDAIAAGCLTLIFLPGLFTGLNENNRHARQVDRPNIAQVRQLWENGAQAKQAGDLDKAKECWQQALTLEPNNSDIKSSLDELNILSDKDFMESKAGRIWLKHKDWSKRTCSTIAKKSVHIGMTKEQAKLSWGAPERVHTTSFTIMGKYHSREQWCYGYSSFLYFNEDDILETIQTSQ